MGGLRYNVVYTRIWTTPAFRALSEDGRLVVLYLLTCPHRNTEGLFRLPIPLAAYDLGWDLDRTRAAFLALEIATFLVLDPAADLVWLITAVEENTPRGPKQIKGATNALAEVPSSPLRDLYLARCRLVSADLADAIVANLGWSEHPTDTHSIGYRSPSGGVFPGVVSGGNGAAGPEPVDTISELGKHAQSIGYRYPSDCSFSFSLSNSTPPTPPPDDIGGPKPAAETALLVALADQTIQEATVDPTALATGSERDLIAAVLAAGHTPAELAQAADDTIAAAANNPRRYLRAILKRLATEPVGNPETLPALEAEEPFLAPPRAGDPIAVADAQRTARANLAAARHRPAEAI